MADHLNTNGLVDGNIPAGHACPFREGCSHRTLRCPDTYAPHERPFSCASARAFSMIANETPEQLADAVDRIAADEDLHGIVSNIEAETLRSAATALRRLGRVRDAADLAVRDAEHNDTCGASLGDYPCNCGLDALREALRSGG